jgi:pilus assembly protein TadC
VSWALAAAYFVAVVLLLVALGTRVEPRLAALLAVVAPAGQRSGLGTWLGRRVSLTGKRLFLAGAGGAIGLTAWPSSPGRGVAASIVLGAAGYRFTDFRTARRRASRRARASAAIPGLLDLVAVSVTAGLTPRLALERAPEAVDGPLSEALTEARHEVELGDSWRAALRRIAAGTGLPELRRLAATLERSERLGAPVADRLRALARDVRAERGAAQEERARRAPVTMLFPLVFLILPAFVLAAVVPAVLVATDGVT